MNINCYSTSDGHYKYNPDGISTCGALNNYPSPRDSPCN